MNQLAVVTPSYLPDAELFAELHRSVLEHTPAPTMHHVIVPPADESFFAHHAGPRCRVWTYAELLPRRFFGVPRAGMWMNAQRPWLLIRGWIMQQALKISVAGLINADAVLLADSDVVLVRPASTARFTVGKQLCLYRVEQAVHAGMDRHIRWHHVARRLLGLPPALKLPLPDYVSPLNVWDPAIVREMQRRISEVTGMNWLDAVTAELHVSEFTLYGVFVDEVLGATAPRPRSDTTFCHDYWERTPLDHDGAMEFVGRMPSDAVGMMISAKSRTPRDVRLAAVRRCIQADG
jgi:hypothetical protein